MEETKTKYMNLMMRMMISLSLPGPFIAQFFDARFSSTYPLSINIRLHRKHLPSKILECPLGFRIEML